jgi:acyl carrier protein
MAQGLADRGARYLVLMSRKGPSESARKQLEKLRADGVMVVVAQADVAVLKDVQRVLAEIKAEMPPLRGIIHAAGILADAALANQTWSQFERVMQPKIEGTLHLDASTRNNPLDFFVLFSAGAAVLGSPGQVNYSAANAFLDGFAQYRRAQGQPALSINWGAWADVGMAANLPDHTQRGWAQQGIGQIKPVDGMRAFGRLLNSPSAQVAVLPIHWQRLKSHQGGAIQPLLRLLMNQDALKGNSSHEKRTISFTEQLSATPPEEQHAFLSKYVLREVGKVLGLDSSYSFSPRQGFTDLGLDSLMAVELSNRLRKDLQLALPSTLTFEYPTIQALTDYLASELLHNSPEDSSEEGISEAEQKTQAIRTKVENISEDQLEDELLKELKAAGY